MSRLLRVLQLLHVLLTHVSSTSAYKRTWNLPLPTTTTTQPSHCISIDTSHCLLLQKLRGGSDRGYGNDDDSYYTDNDPRQQPPQDYYNQDASQAPPRRRSDRYQEEWERPRDDNNNQDDRYYDYYDDRGVDDSRSSSFKKKNDSQLPSLLSRGNRKVGLLLLAAGTAVSMLGISLFFNKTLMRLGNLLFLLGVPLTIGPSRTAGYFLQPKKTRATATLTAGIALVLIGWPILGIAMEIFGLLNLFGNMFPVFWALAKQMPIVGNLLKQNDNNGSSRRRYSEEDDRDRRRGGREEEDRYY